MVPFDPPGSRAEVEEGTAFTPRFDRDGLVACIAVDAQDGRVLMLAHMNAESLQRTLETGEAWYWSRSRRELWHKGATSGQIQRVVEMRTDCDQDALLITVAVGGDGGCCHTGRRACFYRGVTLDPDGRAVLHPAGA
ncbi:phosphoribosyl-AMP cyclohydrolase [Methylobacterium sp. E-041]|jgi:phosphoribosyl-AMP cyclohydrolase|uniref:phosphoribosyl-AMP cyclohydrolase n=1 Tax=unclassified Methylobacterium TaxID=2615210 RepID=UPI0011CA9342|nr:MULTISPECIES: phosphoribosyl-AMP cyclohydrolase [unclassified Methylobacterium]MCJ2009998.1 phosphoribosyl-AMP cyclohydrolase [Methylobacterium sp. J-092]MCJ2039529.1 phosphoribosyl-AMP cyclohydrolase [Methylobacterium sp. J-059]MCJ2077764.1 phosphoribosyl-AMP cyclohydrolase [Methylobacterium sp. E-016]MCJ2104284.1 phosphoribosyl-AMP cyclohydrolase [Methylobacterium sp. E-041]MCJ2113016.1 phosphoribosyl-AMP cyclohydrolase [Methylobacterium sp. E-025]